VLESIVGALLDGRKGSGAVVRRTSTDLENNARLRRSSNRAVRDRLLRQAISMGMERRSGPDQ
jgi:hypothetical protein